MAPFLYAYRYGWDEETAVLQTLRHETIELELAFNKRAGFTATDDHLPEWITQE